MPTRYLKPGVRDSEAIDALSPLAETLFYRLLVTVDDFGRFDARPAMIKSHCFPVKESVNVAKCAALLEELAKCGLVMVYQVDGKPYLQMRKWDNKPRASESAYPAPADTCIQTYTDADIPRTLLPVTVTETKTETKTKTPAPPDGVAHEVWQDWLKIRKAKRLPWTETAWREIQAEIGKSGLSVDMAIRECCARGWGSFRADWHAKVVPVQQLTVPSRMGDDPELEKARRDAANAVPIPLAVLEKMAKIRQTAKA